ncbi:hypothetical protein S83_013217, partial [Arachis hypogaea]
FNQRGTHLTTAFRVVRHSPPPRRQKPVTVHRRDVAYCSSLFSARRSGHPRLCSSLRSPASLLVAPVSLFSGLVSARRSIPPAPGFSRPA